MYTLGRFLQILLCLGLLAGCAYPVRNEPAQDLSPDVGYRWNNLSGRGPSDTLVIVTASGGGTRAAALELSVLEGLDHVKLPDGITLANRIDILSSVSGGSVTAAYFALTGPSGFGNLENDFVRQDGIGAVLSKAIPFGLLRASAPHTERIDFLIDYFDQTLFRKHETYGDLLAKGTRPYLILNAADMVEGVPFSFTQNNFDLLCSDLSKVKLSTAVAASAAFPVALSPVTLKNYSRCPAQPAADWPPQWVTSEAKTNWYDNAERAARGRVQLAYALGGNSPSPKSYIHLLDGGIADNLGIAEPLRILTTNAPAPGMLDDIASGDIKNIIFIVINARSFATSTLDQSQATPSEIDDLSATVSSAIDRASTGSAAALRNALRDNLRARADAERTTHADRAANLERAAANAKLIEVDFDAIADPECRTYFHSIGTSWTNSNAEIDSLLQVGKALLGAAPDFLPAIGELHGQLQGELPSLAQVCRSVRS